MSSTSSTSPVSAISLVGSRKFRNASGPEQKEKLKYNYYIRNIRKNFFFKNVRKYLFVNKTMINIVGGNGYVRIHRNLPDANSWLEDSV